MKAMATIRMKVPSTRKLAIIVSSLEPEVNSPNRRSRVNIEKENNCLVLKIEAKDTVALRASLNSYLRLVSSILNVFQILEKQEVSKQIS